MPRTTRAEWDRREAQRGLVRRGADEMRSFTRRRPLLSGPACELGSCRCEDETGRRDEVESDARTERAMRIPVEGCLPAVFGESSGDQPAEIVDRQAGLVEPIAFQGEIPPVGAGVLGVRVRLPEQGRATARSLSSIGGADRSCRSSLVRPLLSAMTISFGCHENCGSHVCGWRLKKFKCRSGVEICARLPGVRALWWRRGRKQPRSPRRDAPTSCPSRRSRETRGKRRNPA